MWPIPAGARQALYLFGGLYGLARHHVHLARLCSAGATPSQAACAVQCDWTKLPELPDVHSECTLAAMLANSLTGIKAIQLAQLRLRLRHICCDTQWQFWCPFAWSTQKAPQP